MVGIWPAARLALATPVPLLPDLNSRLHPSDSTPWTILFVLTVIPLLPATLMAMTPLVRLLVVFHFLRQALGTQTAPSNPQTLLDGLRAFYVSELSIHAPSYPGLEITLRVGSQARAFRNLEQPEDVGREAARRTLRMLDARRVPTQQVPVVFAPEVARGLVGSIFGAASGAAISRGASIFAGQLGQQVAAESVTVVDDGTIPERRGSLTIDDEGTPTSRTVLIEDGVLTGYLGGQGLITFAIEGGEHESLSSREHLAAAIVVALSAAGWVDLPELADAEGDGGVAVGPVPDPLIRPQASAPETCAPHLPENGKCGPPRGASPLAASRVAASRKNL